MGANRQKGEAGFEVDGRTYVLAFNVNAMCEVEYVLNLSTDAILKALMRSPPLHIVRALLWGGLREHHPNIDLNGAGVLMEEAGGAGPTLEKVGEALMAAFPDPKGGDDTPNPRKGAKAGTGRRS